MRKIFTLAAILAPLFALCCLISCKGPTKESNYNREIQKVFKAHLEWAYTKHGVSLVSDGIGQNNKLHLGVHSATIADLPGARILFVQCTQDLIQRLTENKVVNSSMAPPISIQDINYVISFKLPDGEISKVAWVQNIDDRVYYELLDPKLTTPPVISEPYDEALDLMKTLQTQKRV